MCGSRAHCIEENFSMKVWLYDKCVGVAFVDQNPDREECQAPLPEEEGWEECEIFDAIWMRSEGWGTNTKFFNSSNRDEDMRTYVINAALHIMIQAFRINKRCMFMRMSLLDAEPGIIVSDSPSHPAWNDEQQALLDSLRLGDDSNNTGAEDDNE